MSLHIAKLFKNPLALAGAALVIHIGAAMAADSTATLNNRRGTSSQGPLPLTPPRNPHRARAR